MDKKIIIQLIKQEVEELGLLINALEKQDEPQGVLVKLTKSKIHTLSKVAGLLPGNGQSKPEDALTSGDAVLQQRILDSIVESNKEEEEVISEELSKTTPTDMADEEPVGDYESDSEAKSEPDNSEPDKGEAKLTEMQEPEMESVEQEPEKEKIDEEPDALSEEKTKPEEPKIDKPEEPLAEENQLPEQTPIEEDEVNNKPIQAEAKPEDSEPEIQDSEEEKPRKMVLGERFTKDKSLNEKFTSISESKYKVVGKPVTSVKRAIGLNDRFMFTRELFNNDSDNYNTTLEAIDNANSFVEAIEYLEENCKWPKSETSLKFMELVKRRFDN